MSGDMNLRTQAANWISLMTVLSAVVSVIVLVG